MPDIYLKFMTPDVWDALVLGIIFIGLALAILRLLKDRAVYEHRQRRAHRPDPPSVERPVASPPANSGQSKRRKRE